LIDSEIIRFRLPGAGIADGYEATLLIQICELYLDARDQEVLHPSQVRLARVAETVIAIMKLCDDMPEFRQKFDRVFSKAYQLEIAWDDLDMASCMDGIRAHKRTVGVGTRRPDGWWPCTPSTGLKLRCCAGAGRRSRQVAGGAR
jgi:hypothetical protein